ncbi:ornithine cyclodeaminase family protein [Pelagibius sp. CAU 1746]|uniref:ornithine cyclodeaminase family protein n=1 Tax=Pelagibius sp. CAU 1746 TaxID=3140370 RepID=UPI00325ADA90
MTGMAKPLCRSAAEITKGDLKVMTISEAEVQRLLDPSDLLEGLAEGFRALARGEVQTPDRPAVTLPGTGFLLSMPAWRAGGPIMVKMVSVFEGNLDLGLPNHLAMINLFDETTGAPLCLMDGTCITGIRTAAAAVLSVRLLARPKAAVATIIGAGVQGREHLRLLPLVRDFDEILVTSLNFDDARKLAAGHPRARAVEDPEAAVRRSDVVCLASHSYAPVIEPSWVKPGTHVTSVGYAPPRGELPAVLAHDHQLYVEDGAAFAAPPVGCGELQGIDPAAAIHLGDALLGRAPLRENDEEITVYKAMGIAMEDLVAAELVYRRALAEGNVPSALF